MNNIPVIDLVFLVLIVLMIIHGYVKGFVEEIFSWASLILAVYAAVFFHPAGAEFLRSRGMQNIRLIPEILAFIAVFGAVILVVKLLERVLKEIIAGMRLGGVNKVLGLIFGLLEGLALTAIILFVFTVQPLFDPSNVIEDSIFAQFLLPLIQIPLDRGKETLNIVGVWFLSGVS